MPLCTNSTCFAGYTLDRIPAEVLAHLQSRPEWTKRLSVVVLRLQCFLEVTDQRCPTQDQGTTVVEALFQEFAAATFAGLFGVFSLPWDRVTQIRSAWPTPLSVDIPTTHNPKSWPNGFAERVEHYQKLQIDPDLAEFWQGWTLANANERPSSLAMWRFWKLFGKQRTNEFFKAAQNWFAKGSHRRVPCAQVFIDFACDYGEIDFNDSESLGEFFVQFFRHHFQSGHARGIQLSGLSVSWLSFSSVLRDHLLGKAWATPVPALPSPVIPKTTGSRTHIKTGADGREVKMTLITPIPLHISDGQAKELIFRTIRSDVDAILVWARREAAEARERLEGRKALAPKGTISEVSTVGVNSGIRFRLSRECPDYLAHAAATFESKNFQHLETGRAAKSTYPEPLSKTAWELGLPAPQLLLAHAAVLVCSHPQITPAFLDKLRLFDKDGRQVGLIKTDAGWILCGEKRRRGPAKAEQRVLLNEEALSIVRDVIDLTQPLREWLRAKDKPHWRRLFLGVASMGNQPKAWNPNAVAHSASDWIAERMCLLIGIDTERATLLSERFSLKRLRSSAGVLVYFETGSVEEMAKALGHAMWSPKLLDHYLPKPLQEFFTERWIRLFQTGIICEALKGSSHLLEAAAFQTMDELDAFLENHALRRIPSHLNNPDQPGGAENPTHTQDRIAFGIETGILTILISLQSAVRTASREPCGRAIRWARVSEHLVPFLETQTEQPEFKAMVLEAKRQADPQLVQELIYG